MLPRATGLARRQSWNFPTAASQSVMAHCTPFTLPSDGVLEFADGAITLTTDIVFSPQCTGLALNDVIMPNLKDDFYASTIPMTYVIAAATVIAWILVVMLVVTPRTALFGNLAAGPTLSSGHGIIGGANSGPASLTGTGSRPWLQKVAALTVAISLTIATSDTFHVAAEQYALGIMNTDAMRMRVLNSKEIKISRIVSDVFLWLAQVQTLIRLFPRHKEKVLIKWIGFALIIFDSLFSCLNSFLDEPAQTTARHFVNAIPALSYLFQLSLGLLYAAWVIFFALTKYRYAFWHKKMRSICLIAILSLVAVLTPVVFFVTDISNSNVAGWGDYVRWVGAAAASVVVWEWVDRIEALERDEKKDGILGREIFDGDEMLDLTPSEAWGYSRSRRRPPSENSHGGGYPLEHGLTNVFRNRASQPPPDHFPLGRAHSSSEPTNSDQMPASVPSAMVTGRGPRGTAPQTNNNGLLGNLTAPAQPPTPVSRAETTSAASTVYVVHDALADVPQPVRRRLDFSRNKPQPQPQSQPRHPQRPSNEKKSLVDVAEEDEDARPPRPRDQSRWHTVSNPFKRKRASPPKEIQEARAAAIEAARVATPAHNFSKWDFKNRLGVLAAETGDRLREKGAHNHGAQASLPITVIPAPPRGSNRHWSPANDDSVVHTEGLVTHSHGNTVSTQPQSTASPTPGPSSSSPVNVRSQASRVVGRSGGGGDVRPRSASPPTVTFARSADWGPPRADDISPSLGSSRTASGAIVIPAPPRRSPANLPSVQSSSPPPPPTTATTTTTDFASSGSSPTLTNSERRL